MRYQNYNAETALNEKMAKDQEWILKVIGSCETVFQLRCCFKLVDYFKLKYEDCHEELDEMMERLVGKQSVIEVFY